MRVQLSRFIRSMLTLFCPYQAGRNVDVEAGNLPRGELGKRDPPHGGVVGTERRRRNEDFNAQRGGHLGEPLPERGVRRHATSHA